LIFFLGKSRYYRNEKGWLDKWTDEQTLMLLTLCQTHAINGTSIRWKPIADQMMQYGIFKDPVLCSYKYFNIKSAYKKIMQKNDGRHRYSAEYWELMKINFGQNRFNDTLTLDRLT
jgi:hypothetical protein